MQWTILLWLNKAACLLPGGGAAHGGHLAGAGAAVQDQVGQGLEREGGRTEEQGRGGGEGCQRGGLSQMVWWAGRWVGSGMDRPGLLAKAVWVGDPPPFHPWSAIAHAHGACIHRAPPQTVYAPPKNSVRPPPYSVRPPLPEPRSAIAEAYGAESFAHLRLRGSAAGSPEAAITFLQHTATLLAPLAREQVRHPPPASLSHDVIMNGTSPASLSHAD